MAFADRVKFLQEARVKAWEKEKAIWDAADGRALSVEERTSVDALDVEIASNDAEIRDLTEREERNVQADALRTKHEALFVPNVENRTGDFDAEVRSYLKGETRGSQDKWGGLAVQDKEQRNTKYWRQMRDEALGGETRTLSRLTAGAGQNTVKTSFYDSLVQNLIVNAAMLQAGPTVLSTTSGEIIQIPKTLTHSAGALFAEAATITNSDPTFGQVSLGAYKYAALVQVSRELIDDTSVDLLGYLAFEMGRAVGNAVGADFIVGNGTAKPRGITIDTTLGVTGGAGVVGVFTADNLIDLFYSVAPPYRASSSAAWMFADATFAQVRKLKDTTNRYLWEPSLVVGAPDTILGKRVVTDPNVAVTALSAKSVIFGDFSRYYVREVSGVRFEQSNDYAFANDLVTFKAAWRADGALIDLTGAVKHFIGNAA